MTSKNSGGNRYLQLDRFLIDMQISFIPYQLIDKVKWNNCVAVSSNGLVYAQSIYLDHMADHWDGLVMNDYEAVMPLTWKQKMGIRYLYQPAFFQQGGIFSASAITVEMVDAFISAAKKYFPFAECTLNYGNPAPTSVSFEMRNNYLLQFNQFLSADIENEYLKQRIKRAEKFNLRYANSDDIEASVVLYQQLYHHRISGFRSADFNRFIDLCSLLQKENKILIRTVFEADTLLASALFIVDNNRLYNLASCLLAEGKSKLANYFLIHQLMKEFEHTDIVLDFEGSDVEGIAYFYQKWATAEQPYLFISWNHLPKTIQLLRRLFSYFQKTFAFLNPKFMKRN